MIGFIQFIIELYQEESDSVFQENNKKYDLNSIFKYAEKIKAKKYRVQDLDWILKYTKTPFNQRTKKSNVNIPIIITKENNKFVVIDGIHRLKKAVMSNKKDIECKFIEHNSLKQFLKR